MRRIVFLVEEHSMRVLLEGLLPRLYPGIEFQCVTHEGKQDLDRSIPRKLRAWREPGVRFVIVRDNDGADCKALKRRLESLCREGTREDSLVRLACQELEAWYLGDLETLGECYSKARLDRVADTARLRDVDAVRSPAREVERLVPEFQKVSGARRMAQRLRRDRNRSRSFLFLLQGIDRLLSPP